MYAGLQEKCPLFLSYWWNTILYSFDRTSLIQII